MHLCDVNNGFVDFILLPSMCSFKMSINWHCEGHNALATIDRGLKVR